MSEALKKLKNRSGETLAETLVALLVVAMASSVLYAMLNGSISILRKTSDAYDEIYDDISRAESRSGTGINGTMKIGSGTHQSDVSIQWYGERVLSFGKG